MLDNVRLVDLTIPLDSNTVMWPGAAAPQAETVVTVKDFGRFARNVSFSEHAGTHVDAPSHFIDGGQNVDEIPLETLVRPIAMIDISSRIGSNANGELLLADVLAFESDHGRIPQGAAVLLRTGWEDFNRNSEKYAGKVGDVRFPGYGVEAAQYLVNERGAVGLGIDTLGIDPGSATTFPVHEKVTHPKGVWHLENLQNLKKLPPLTAWIFVGVLPLVGGSGSPARVIALIP